MSILDKLFGGGNKPNPMDEANKYLSQIPRQSHETYDPYITQGKASGTNLHNHYEELMNDPQGFINKIMSGYKPSESYQFQKSELQDALGNTAAVGGYAGTPLDQRNQGEQIQKLLSGDQQQWLSNILGVYNKGVSGEEGESERGYNASKGLNDDIGGSLNQQGGLAFNQAQQKNKDKQAMIRALMKALGLGAGFAYGGPSGAATGSEIANNIFA